VKGTSAVNTSSTPYGDIPDPLDLALLGEIWEFLAQDQDRLRAWTASQVAVHFRLPASAEPEIARIMAAIGVAAVPPPESEGYRPAPRDLAALAAEIRQAWLITAAAIPLPATEPVDMDNPVVICAVQAREQAFGWALSELVDGNYTAPEHQLAALEGGMLPAPETDMQP
jgi:hypothetical protein